MAFNPDAYLTGNGGFDPDAYLTGSTSTPSLAEKTVSAITPENPQAQQGNFLQRLYAGTKEMFAPSMEGIKRLFNPNAGQFGLLRVLEQAGQQVGQAVRGAAQNTADQISTSKFGQTNPNVAAGLGATYGTIADVTSNSLTPSAFQQQLGAEGITSLAPEALSALGKEAESLSKAATSSSLGFNKSVLNKVRGGSVRAGEAAGEMMDRGVVGPFSSPRTMLDRATAIQQEAGSHIGAIQKSIDASGKMPLNAGEISAKISDELMPSAKGGIADKLRSAVQNIVDTVHGYGNGPVTFEQMADIKKLVDPGRWGDAQMANLGEDAKKLFDFRQRATAIIGNSMDNAAKSALGELDAKSFTEAKRVYGLASEAIKGLSDKVDRIAGRRFLDLPSSIAGASGLTYSFITGNPMAALKTIGAIGAEKYIQTYGPQQAALTFRAIANALEKQGISAGLGSATAIATKQLPQGPVQIGQQLQGFPALIQKAKANQAMKGEITDSGLNDFVNKSPVGTRFVYQGKPMKVVPSKIRDTSTLSESQKSVLFSSKKLNRGRKTFAPA